MKYVARTSKPAPKPSKPAKSPRRQAPGKRPVAVAPAEKSLADVGREAAREAQRRVLLASLKRHRWNLAAVGAELSVGSSANVLRSIRSLDLMDEYKAARIAQVEASE